MVCYRHEPAPVEKPPSRVRGPLDEPEGDGSDDPLDQRQMQQIIMLRFTSPSHKNSLEEHVADEELEAAKLYMANSFRSAHSMPSNTSGARY